MDIKEAIAKLREWAEQEVREATPQITWITEVGVQVRLAGKIGVFATQAAAHMERAQALSRAAHWLEKEAAK